MPYKLKILDVNTSIDEAINLCAEAGIADMGNFKRLMLRYIDNSWSLSPELDKGIVYGVYDGDALLAATRIKQDDYIYAAASIEFVAVKEEYRGKGIGRFLITSILDEIKDKYKKEMAVLATRDESKF